MTAAALVVRPCPLCGGPLELVLDGSIGLRPAPFVSCSSCEFCEAADTSTSGRGIDPAADPSTYFVYAETLSAPARQVTYNTQDGHDAALCAWCLETEALVEVEWSRQPFGLQAVSVKKAVLR